MDIWALLLFFSGLYLVFRYRDRTSFWGWFLIFLSLNVRPAYLLPVVFSVIFGLFINRGSIKSLLIKLSPSALLSISPQLFLNLVGHKVLLPWPMQSGLIGSIQIPYASYIVRYDTVAYDQTRNPAQFFCSPGMSKIVSGNVPQDTQDLVLFFVSNLPASAVFALEKISSTLLWSSGTPYLLNPTQAVGLFSIIVAAILGFGIAGLWFSRAEFRTNRSFPLLKPLLLTFLAVVLTIPLTTPESRFSAPLVFVGIIGLVLTLVAPVRRSLWLFTSMFVTGSIIVFGSIGLSNPAPAGPVSPEVCLEIQNSNLAFLG
jgi:hypothetical protein